MFRMFREHLEKNIHIIHNKSHFNNNVLKMLAQNIPRMQKHNVCWMFN